ncbi:MAG TPA: PD-(D/E)XK nuclease family protein [Ignavibacteria bacterium]|nr:PD-(D/E)XK nuclease family protein [Ignavibacteria bacterium]
MNRIELDNTKRSTFVACPRQFYWSQVLHLQPKFGSTAIRYGVAFHALLEGYYTYIKENGWNIMLDPDAIMAAHKAGKESWEEETEGREYMEDFRTFDMCVSTFVEYLTKYDYDLESMEVLAVEEIFYGDFNFEINGIPLYFMGIIDMVIKRDGLIWIVDHKTTGQPLAKMANVLHRSPSFIGYEWAARNFLNLDSQGITVNYIHTSAYRSRKTGEYTSYKKDFSRYPQVYSDHDLEQWRNSFIYTAYKIEECLSRDEWPMYFDSCYNYNKSCSYTGLCEQPCNYKEVNTEGFVTRKWDPRNRDKTVF